MIATVAASLVPSAARADMAARDLVEACQFVVASAQDKSRPAPNDLKSGVCIGFLAAINGVLLFEDEAGRRKLGICTPDHMNALALLSSTERFLVKNPDDMGKRAIIVALSAAQHDYPCHTN